MIVSGILSALGFLKKVPREVWLIAIAIGAVWWWGESRYNAGQDGERTKRDRAITEAVIKAVEAERHAQAEHDKREEERHSRTRDLREAAAKAPAGEKTKAVLDSLRQ